MAKTRLEQTVTRFAEKNGLSVEWQDLRFGFRRAVITTDDYIRHYALLDHLGRYSSLHAHSSCHIGLGTFEGVITIMGAKEKVKLDNLLAEEKARNEDWWQRYHKADDEIRRLMACGAIA